MHLIKWGEEDSSCSVRVVNWAVKVEEVDCFLLGFAAPSEASHIFNEARGRRASKRIEWNNVSSEVDVSQFCVSASISRDPSRVISSSSRLARFAQLTF